MNTDAGATTRFATAALTTAIDELRAEAVATGNDAMRAQARGFQILATDLKRRRERLLSLAEILDDLMSERKANGRTK
jgi:hypothetical protein